MAVLDKIRALRFDTIRARPKVSKTDRLMLLLRVTARRLPRPAPQGFPTCPALTSLSRTCRRVARARARNFHYSFLLLPKEQKNAMCAIYAFMRYSDDISDDGSPPLENRQKRLDAWRTKLADALAGRFGNDPVLPAFAAAIDRYDIPRSYFTELIDGMQSDLRPAVYRTFDELYRYCYQAPRWSA